MYGGTTTVVHTHYIRAGDQVITIAQRTGTGALWLRYPHRDHLGSIVALTDASGALIERSGFDPWGKRTDYSTWNPPPVNTFLKGGSGAGGTTNAVTSTTRGYTGHEMVDEFGFIHMNGRIYDPEIGKFMSADPTMQFPESTQGFNRYAYAGNNPLTNVDPSGFGWFKSILQIAGFALQFVSFALPGWGQLANMLLKGFVTGFLSAGGDLKAGLLGMVGAGLFSGTHFLAGKWGLNSFTHALLKGLAGGALSAMAGGKFGAGLLGAFAGGFLGDEVGDKFGGQTGQGGVTGLIKRVVRDAILGGIAAVAGGGKFLNGAATAAYARLYNDEAIKHRDTQADKFKKQNDAKIARAGHRPAGALLVVTHDTIMGVEVADHTALYLNDGKGSSFLLDGDGTYKGRIADDQGNWSPAESRQAGCTDVFTGQEFRLDDYMEYQVDAGSGNVRISIVELSLNETETANLSAYFKTASYEPGVLGCASAASNYLNHIPNPAYQNIGSRFPGRLESQVGAIKGNSSW